jgi:predicted nucleic acid-binding protein
MGWIDPLRNTIVGLDTAPLIYFIEKHPTYFPILLPFFESVHNGEIQLVTSTLTLTEVLVVPYRSGNRSLALEYTRILLNSHNLTVLPVSEAIAQEAARIRAAHGYKVPDAIHIATARLGNADAFLTNDAAFASLPGMQAILLDRLRS